MYQQYCKRSGGLADFTKTMQQVEVSNTALLLTGIFTNSVY